MALTKEHLRAVMTGTQVDRVEELRKVLGYPVKQRDPKGSRFWYLRPGVSEVDAAETCPIAVGFYSELSNASEQDLRRFLTTQKQQQEIYGHYIQRVDLDQPVMYLLLPEANQQGQVALVLPIEGGLRQRQIQTFDWSDRELLGRLSRLQQGTLQVAPRALYSIPQIDWVFYPGVKTAGQLAQLMAGIAKQIEQAVPSVYAAQGTEGYLPKLFESFRKELLPTLKVQADNEKDYSFADIYAQTVAYGLFTARVFSFLKFKKEQEKNPNYIEPDFYRNDAWKCLPETNPFLRKLFEDISNQPPKELGEDLVSAVSELLSVLRAAEMDAVLSDFEQKIGQEDIIVRFYEDFLKAYKPQMRERRGVYYTPEPVVSYMVRSVDILLKEKFNKPLGLADPEVMILDPACGTGTFLLWICQLIYQRFQELPEALTEGLADKSWSGYVKERLLPRIFGFELLMAPYAIAHLKLSLFLEETGYQFDRGKRLRVYLTDTLDNTSRKSETLFEEFIAEEADQAIEIKRDEPVMVIIGNPPYSYESSNTGAWISSLVRDYYYVDNQYLNERNPKGLQDDYVKFIRFAQWKIQETGHGILAFINNHGYIDNPTFRGMRWSLMKTFSEINILDLHGNTKKKERNPDGSKDENVFDIQQGVSINFFTKFLEESSCKVYYSDLWGAREIYNVQNKFNALNLVNGKYHWLLRNSISTTKKENIKPNPNFYLFLPQNTDLLPEYEQGWKITDIMTVNSLGIATARDSLTIQWNKIHLKYVVSDFADLSEIEARVKYNLGKDTRDWRVLLAQQDLKESQFHQSNFLQIYYRPFDIRQTYYTGRCRGFHCMPRDEVMRHMKESENIALCFIRRSREQVLSNFFVVKHIVDKTVLSSADNANVAPLYLYPHTNNPQKSILKEQRCSNLSQNFLNAITNKLGYTPTPEAIFYYIYAIFHSPTYRTRYAEFLKIDFPRVPLTSNDHLFRQLAAYGEELVALHLMKSPKLDNTITQFCDRGGDQVVDIAPKYQQGDVIINKKGDRFSQVPENVWNFYVGGYQVCQKWLKDRKGRTLSSEDILHYQRIVVALRETIELMARIDAAIPGFPIQ